jgi:hypothetical protein
VFAKGIIQLGNYVNPLMILASRLIDLRKSSCKPILKLFECNAADFSENHKKCLSSFHYLFTLYTFIHGVVKRFIRIFFNLRQFSTKFKLRAVLQTLTPEQTAPMEMFARGRDGNSVKVGRGQNRRFQYADTHTGTDYKILEMARVQTPFFVGYSVGQKMLREKDNAEYGITVNISPCKFPQFLVILHSAFGSSIVEGCGLPFSRLYSVGHFAPTKK